jgi:hypothetical protein
MCAAHYARLQYWQKKESSLAGDAGAREGNEEESRKAGHVCLANCWGDMWIREEQNSRSRAFRDHCLSGFSRKCTVAAYQMRTTPLHPTLSGRVMASHPSANDDDTEKSIASLEFSFIL